LLWFHRNKM